MWHNKYISKLFKMMNVFYFKMKHILLFYFYFYVGRYFKVEKMHRFSTTQDVK